MDATILLVDDQADTVAELSRCLSRHGCTVLVAESGMRALSRARRHRPDAVLIDLMLHDSDAFSICEELRRFPGTAAVPVIVMTSLASEMARSPDYASRADAFLAKPCQPEELIRTIEKVLRRPDAAFPASVPFTLFGQGTA